MAKFEFYTMIFIRFNNYYASIISKGSRCRYCMADNSYTGETTAHLVHSLDELTFYFSPIKIHIIMTDAITATL
jgi:hypothetical protein